MSFSSRSKIFSFAIVGVSLLALSACTHPHSMPTGYTYHDELYKSPAPPLPYTITAEQRKYMDATQAEQFRDGTYALLEKLTMRAGMPPKPVYVLTPTPLTSFYANIDNDLRENMRHIGYALSDTPNEAYIFTYDALYLAPAEGTVPKVGVPNTQLTLRVYNKLGADARLLSTETGQFYIQGAETLKIQPASYNNLPPIIVTAQ